VLSGKAFLLVNKQTEFFVIFISYIYIYILTQMSEIDFLIMIAIGTFPRPPDYEIRRRKLIHSHYKGGNTCPKMMTV